MPDESLYDRDFYTWTQDQARRLRELHGHNRLDTRHLADEVEDLGKRDLRDVRAHLRQLLTHIAKLAASPAEEQRAHWLVEAREHHAQALDAFSLGLRQHLDLDALWIAARRDADTLPIDHGEPGIPDDVSCPVSLDDILNPDFDVADAARRLRDVLGSGSGPAGRP